MMFQLFSQDDLMRLHEASIEILTKIGIATQSKRFASLLLDHGCKKNGERYLFTQDIIDKALKTVPSTWDICGWNGTNKLEMGKQKAYGQTCIGLPSIQDIETGERRDVLLKDLEDFTRLTDALEYIHLMSPVYPRDIPQETAISRQTATMLRNTTKPIKLCLESAHEWKYVYEILVAAAGSEKALKENGLGYYEVSPISPLDFADGPAEAMMDIVESGLPFGVIPAPMMGATAPITFAGGIAQHNAEMLAGVVATQLIRPGSKVIMSNRLGALDLKTGVALWAMPEMGQAAAACVHLSRYYNIPSGGGCYTGASKVADAQSGYERLYNALLPALAGVDVCGTAGAVDNALVASLDMLVIDNEMSSVIQKTLKGFAVNEETLGLDVLADVINKGGTFLDQKHTRTHMRAGEHWLPTISQRMPYEAWESKGGAWMHQIAKQKAKDILANHQSVPVAPEVSAEFDRIIERAQVELSK